MQRLETYEKLMLASPTSRVCRSVTRKPSSNSEDGLSRKAIAVTSDAAPYSGLIDIERSDAVYSK
jgi:hypothetical protein